MSERQSAPRRAARVEFGLAVGLDLIAAALVLVLSTRVWQSVLLPRPRPLRDEVLHVSGRTVTAAPTALALVALAGVVAVLASRGTVRRLIGVVLVGAGVGVVVAAVGGMHRLSGARIRSLAEDRNVVGIGAAEGWRVSLHTGWAWGTVAAGVVVVLAGLVVCARGGRWAGMSTRYAAPSGDRNTGSGPARVPGSADSGTGSAAATDLRTQASMWSALERGDDPTAPPTEPR